MGNGYSLNTLKVKSKIGSQRIATHLSKKQNGLVKQRREIAKLIAEDKEQSARIRVEGIIREENLCQVYEWLQMMLDLLHQRVRQIDSSNTCPEDLTETVCTILYCAKRVDIPELEEIGRLLASKWGKKWLEANMDNRSGRVSRQIIDKLSPQPPTRDEVISKLKSIAEKHDIDYEPGANDNAGMAIVGHRDEYTVEFQSKPFGMEWTATEDNMNLWVSQVHDVSPAKRAGVTVGSMLVAFNGIPVTNLGGPTIHEKAAALGLPLRITFRKRSGDVPMGSGDQNVRPDVVNVLVNLLKDPSRWDMSDDQKKNLCKEHNATPAEIHSAMFLAEYMIEQMNNPQHSMPQPPMGQQAYQPQPPQGYMPQNQYPPNNMTGMYSPQPGPQGQPQQPYQAQQPYQPQNPPSGGAFGGQPINSAFNSNNSVPTATSGPAPGPSGGYDDFSMPSPPPSNNKQPPTGGADGGVSPDDDLEARFARLRDGL